MKKIWIFIIIVSLALVIGIPIAYAVFEDWQPAIGDFFGGLRQSASVVFVQASNWFITLPYWPVILGVGMLVTGYLLGHFNQVWWVRLKGTFTRSNIRDSGLQPQYQNQPTAQTPTIIPTATPPAAQPAPLPVLPPKEAE